MMQQEQEHLVYETALGLSQAQNLELVEVKIGRHKKDVLIQVLVDKAQGGINLEECSLFNRSLVEALDKTGIFIEDGFSLEVASPGLDRPLVTYRDFLRNAGQEVRVWLKQQVAGKIEHLGSIKSATPQELVLVTTKGQEEVIIPINQVIKALLVI